MRYLQVLLTTCLLLAAGPPAAAAPPVNPPGGGPPASIKPLAPPSNCIWDGAIPRGGPDVCIGKRLDSPAPLVRGQTATYSLVVSNTAQIDSNTPITVTDILPQGLEVAGIAPPSTDWRCMTSAGAARCIRSGRIAPITQETLILTVTVGLAAPAVIINCASVAMSGDSDPTNNDSCFEAPVVWRYRLFGPIVLRESSAIPAPPPGTP